MNQYFKTQLKTPTCFGSLGIHPQGALKRASLKLLEMFCVRSRCLAAWSLDLWYVFLVRRNRNTHRRSKFSRCQTPTTHTKHLK